MILKNIHSLQQWERFELYKNYEFLYYGSYQERSECYARVASFMSFSCILILRFVQETKEKLLVFGSLLVQLIISSDHHY